MANIVRYETEHGEVTLSPEIIKRYLVQGQADKVTDQEVMMFLRLCQYQQLNPFLREAYLIKYGDSANIVVGKDAFTKRAAKNELCQGWEAGVIVAIRDGKLTQRQGSLVVKGETLVGGWARVHRRDWKVPVEVTVSLEEYNRGTSTWRNMPATMIRKVALVQALREAFPEQFQGMYSAEEMPVDDSVLSREPIDISPESEHEAEKDPEPPMCTDEQFKRMLQLGKQKNLTNDLFKQVAEEVTGKATLKATDFTYEEAERIIKYLEQLPPLETDNAEKTEDKPDRRPITDKQHKRIFALAKGDTDLVKQVVSAYGFASSKAVTRDKYEEICNEIERIIAEREAEQNRGEQTQLPF